MYDFATARLNMVQNQIATNRVFDDRILEAMATIPRHNFVEGDWQQVAYLDRRIPLAEGREMLQPDVMARMLQLAQIEDGDRVLDVACGTGYSTALLCSLANQVVAIDDRPALVAQAAINLDELGLTNFTLKVAPLSMGAQDFSPFQAIVVNGILANDSTAILLSQLSKGGRLIVIEEVDSVPRAVLYLNTGNGVIGRTEHFEAYASKL